MAGFYIIYAFISVIQGVRLGRLGDHAMESMGQSPVVDPGEASSNTSYLGNLLNKDSKVIGSVPF